MFLALKASDAALKIAISSTPDAIACSSPLMLGTSTGPPPDSGQDFGRISHLRNPSWRYEGAGFDHGQAGIGQPVDQLDLYSRRDDNLLVLKPVARTDFDNFDPVRQGHVMPPGNR